MYAVCSKKSLSTFIGLALLGLSSFAMAQPNDDLSLFISKFGQPDQITSSEHETPRPPIVTKQLIYKKENVRAIYVPDAPVGSPPPYKGWKLLGFQDHRTNQVLKAEEVVRRLQKRTKQ
jgi:hypothetical protein